MFIVFVLSLLVIAFAIYVNWLLYTKAGYPGWASIVPIYNLYILCKIVTGKGILLLLAFIPFVNAIFYIYLCIKLATAFGKGIGFGIGIIFLPIIFVPMLALGDATYVGPVE